LFRFFWLLMFATARPYSRNVANLANLAGKDLAPMTR